MKFETVKLCIEECPNLKENNKKSLMVELLWSVRLQAFEI